jgi:hypothetical protein
MNTTAFQQTEMPVPSSVLSGESDDGIPVPSVTVQELKAMLDFSSSVTNAEEATQATEYNDTSLQAVGSRNRFFGMSTVFTYRHGKDEDCFQIHSQVQEEPDKGNGVHRTDIGQVKVDPPTPWNANLQITKSLTDSVSIESSVEGTSVQVLRKLQK